MIVIALILGLESLRGRMTMNRLILVAALFIFVFYVGISSAADIKAETGFYFDWWKDDAHRRGQQAYIPISLEGQFKEFSIKVLTGEAYTQLDPLGSSSRSLTHLLDTKVNLSYEILGKLPVDLLIGLDFNLPTGKSDLKTKDQVLMMDPDLVSITKFGEGFNINPTLSLAKEWGKLVTGVGVGYVWRGEYHFTTKLLEIWDEFTFTTQRYYARDYDPGDIFNVNAEVRYDVLTNGQARLFGNYVWYGIDKLKNKNFYQEGDLLLLGLGFQYNQKKWDAGFTFRSIFRNKSKIKQDLGNVWAYPESEWYVRGLSQPIHTEDQNSHGDEWVADLSIRYFWDEKTTIKSFLQGLYITKNDYPSNSSRFIGRREKGSLGLGISRIFLPYLKGELFVKGFLMHDEERFLPEFLGERDYRGYSVGLQLTGRF